MSRLAVAAVSLLLLAGCVTTSRMPTYVVEFTLTNASDSTRLVSDYPHCGTSHLRQRDLTVDAPKPRGPALVHVDPRFEGNFVATGTEDLALGLHGPVRVPDGLEGTDFAVVTLELRDGVLLINGVARELPFSGESSIPGWWNATYTVRAGPDTVRIDHRTYTCA